MAAAMALMESPAIVFAVLMANHIRRNQVGVTVPGSPPAISAPLGSVLREIDIPDLDSVTETLRTVLPDRGLRIVHPQVRDLAINKHCEDRFRRDLITILDKAAPALILQPAGLSLPAHLSQPGISTFAFSPITSEILCAYLSIIGPKGLNTRDFPAMLPPEGLDLKDYLGNLEQGLIQQALDEAGGVVARAAERLRIRRTTLVEKMRKYGMNRRDDDEQSDD